MQVSKKPGKLTNGKILQALKQLLHQNLQYNSKYGQVCQSKGLGYKAQMQHCKWPHNRAIYKDKSK